MALHVANQSVISPPVGSGQNAERQLRPVDIWNIVDRQMSGQWTERRKAIETGGNLFVSEFVHHSGQWTERRKAIETLIGP